MATATLTFQYHNGSDWVDISSDVLSSPSPTWTRGISSEEPTALLAAAGKLTFYLNNSASNANTTAGYYSPDHASVATGFDLGAKVRLKSTYSAADKYQFYGLITSITPTPGKFGTRSTEVEVSDYMHELAERNVDLLTIQANKTSNQLLTTLISGMDVAPLATDYATGPDTFASSFFDMQGEKQTANSVAQRIIQSDLSKLWVIGDATGGETLQLINRHDDIGKTSQLTLNDTMEGLQIKRVRSNIYNRAVITMQTPIPSVANEVIYTLPLEKAIQPGQSWTFTALYRDPDGGRRVNASDVVTPVVDTDYKLSSISGSGNDLNASLGVSITKGSDRSDLTLTNNHATKTGYLHFFQLRGLCQRLRDPVEIVSSDATSITSFGEKSLRVSASYLSNENTAKSMGDYFVTNHKNPRTQISRVSFTGNKSSTLMSAAVNLDLGDMITITETQSGLSVNRIIISRTVTVKPGQLWNVEYLTTYSTDGAFWLLGTANYSEIGESTTLGF